LADIEVAGGRGTAPIPKPLKAALSKARLRFEAMGFDARRASRAVVAALRGIAQLGAG
jgi:hypothetical protein